MRKTRAKKTKPKPRKVWKINPKSRVKKSEKKYSRPKGKNLLRRITDKFDWFGDK